MSQSIPASRTTPWHLWVVGVLTLLWNGVGAFDFVMTESRNASYMSAFTAEQLAYFYAFPLWAIATCAVSVWGSVLGASLATIVLTSLYQFVLSSGLAVMGAAAGLIFSAVIFVIAVALLLYAWSLSRHGVLR